MATTTNDEAKTSPPGATPPLQYEYMFESNKSPTKQLDALLRAIARHLVRQDNKELSACGASH